MLLVDGWLKLNLHYTPLMLPLIGAAAVVLALAVYALRRRRIPGAGTFIVLMLAVCEWCLAYAVVIAGTDVDTKMLWYKVEYLGVVVVPTAWFMFALRYTRQRIASDRRFLALLVVEPLLTMLTAVTNEAHHLMWPAAHVEEVGSFLALAVEFGPGYWSNTLYSYAIALAGTVVLAWTLIRARRFYSRQAVALVVASIAPVLGNAIYSAKLSADLDLAPFSFGVTGVAFFWGFLRYGFLDVVPIARGSVFDAIADGVLVVDDRDRIVDLNPVACRVLNATPGLTVGRHLNDVLPMCEADAEVSLVVDGVQRQFEVRVSTVFHGAHGAVGRLVLLHDVSDQKAAALALRASEARFKAQYKNLSTPTYSWQYQDDDFVLVDYNDAALEASGGRVAQIIGGRASALFGDYNHAMVDMRQCFVGRETFKRELNDERGSTTRLLDVTYTFVEPDLVMVHSEDITERRQAELALEYLALHDPLTNLPNRELLRRKLTAALTDGAETPFALLMMDLDRFKEVNDTLGHGCGDMLLREVGARLRGAVAEEHVVARLGGDEFAMLLLGASEDDAIVAAQRVIDALEAPFEVQGSAIQAGVSIGIAFSPRDGRGADDLVRRADVAMYSAKRAKSGFAVYDPRHDEHRPDRLSLVPELRRAIERDELFLHYQPKIELSTGRVVGAEALLRWRHPHRGLVPPTEFIQIAEQTGLINALSRWVLSAGVEQCAAWRAAGYDIPLAVNLSMHDLDDVSLPARLASLLSAWQVPATSLEVEITESMLMCDPERAALVTAQLGKLGVRVAVDDFGTGYSSLAYLKRLHIDTLKIDQSLVGDVADQATDRVIVKSMIDLAHGLGLRVVAEGVEDDATRTLLRHLGCDEAQGYLLARPMSAADLTRTLEAPALAA